MAEHRPTTAMDPPHITEFASERYFEKLSQLNASQQQQQQQQQQQLQQQHHHRHEQVEGSAATVSPSTFILPLRESSRHAEADVARVPETKRDKSRFFSIRRKVSHLHTKPHSVETEPVALLQTRASTESTRKRFEPTRRCRAFHVAHLTYLSTSAPFDQLFLALPNELQVQIISSLPLTDVLNLRLASKSWHALITLNEAPIVRHHLDHHIPAYALRLYPISDNSEFTFHYLCSLWHRLHVAAKLAFLMCEWITKDIFLRQSEAQRAAFAPQHERMRRRLIPLLFTVFHFFETYRKLHLKHLAEHGGQGLQREPYTLNPIEKEIMDMYDDRTLLRVHEVFPLVISSFCRRLRPPTYVGRVERSIRGYLRERPSDEVHVAILCIGGLRQVERLWEIKGYNSRRTAVDTWYHGLTKDHGTDAPAKSRLGLKGFGRKKSTSGDRPGGRFSFSEGSGKVRSPTGSIDATNSGGYFDPNWVFNTSLAADVPMAQLGKETAQSILGDLPVLQQIWLTTAEATILDRGIVSRTQDIKRNQQVMLDLIREDGLDEEDEWWYGRNIPDSVRPPASATDEDAD
ncbi:cyclin-like F-box [Purpureocillium lavendulum]|uniref:Cyclin-like F-box n=1 Tax=Purpureocillium lavendulum TaxID=1247861 RepID=A0AB34G241_9HYPO|nr:cyclin-like F-box [Purpureocillium lavendulum]